MEGGEVCVCEGVGQRVARGSLIFGESRAVSDSAASVKSNPSNQREGAPHYEHSETYPQKTKIQK